jgi:hypothetical protein
MRPGLDAEALDGVIESNAKVSTGKPPEDATASPVRVLGSEADPALAGAALARRLPRWDTPGWHAPGVPSAIIRAKWSEAEWVLRESLAIRDKAIPDDGSRFDVMSLLGGAVLGQGRDVQAEPPIVPDPEPRRR